MRSTYHYRSFFWPAVLILIGVVALLANTGQISTERLYNLVNLWPLILIVFGLELIVRRSLHGVGGDIAAALIILLAIIGATAYVAAAPTTSAGQSFDASADLGSISTAGLEIDSGAAQITITGTDVGSSLYRAHIDYSGPRPEVSLDRSSGELRISQPNGFFSFQGQRFQLDLQLNTTIPWKITQNSGAATDTYNLQNVRLQSLSLNTGAGRHEISLGAPTGQVPVSMNGGSLTVRIHRPNGTGTSVDISGGAVSLDFDGQSYHAIGHIAVGNASAADGYKIQVNGGACSVTVDSSGLD